MNEATWSNNSALSANGATDTDTATTEATAIDTDIQMQIRIKHAETDSSRLQNTLCLVLCQQSQRSTEDI